MIINTKIFNATVEAAKAKCAGNAAMLRAIDRAVYEINRSRYWAYDAQTNTLRIQSTTSRKLYVVDDAHTCEATAKGNRCCKHLVARRLMQRYSEALAVTSVEVETKRVQNWTAKHGATIVTHTSAKIADACGVVSIKGQVTAAPVPTPSPSRLIEAAAAPLVPRTIKGEKYAGVDI